MTTIESLILRSRSVVFTPRQRDALYHSANLIVLEDTSGFLLTEDGGRIVQETGSEGVNGKLRDRSIAFSGWSSE